MKRPALQWDGDNADAFDRLLSEHLARADKHGDKLHLIGIGLNVELNLGDSLVIEGDRIGIVRQSTEEPEVLTWTGSNVPAFNEFLAPYGIWLAVQGEMLCVYGGDQLMAALNRGDKIEKRGMQIYVSRAGKDHRN